jgi:hypothetical protein
VQGKTGGASGAVAVQHETQQAIEMRHVADEENRPGLLSQLVAYPRRRILRLQSAHRCEWRERIARAPEQLGGLTGTKLSAVPHVVRLHTSRGCLRRQSRCSGAPCLGQRPHGIDVGPDGLGVVNEYNHCQTRM